MKKRILDGTALVALLLACVVVRVVWSSRVEWKAAQSAAGDVELTALGRAARLYAPGNPYSRRAVTRLAEIGRSDPARALGAWRELRSALLATRSFYTPHPALLAEANQHIAELMADAEAQSGKPREAARAWHAARLAEDYAPSLPWTVLALLGLFAWIGCAIGLLLRGIGDDDRLRPRLALAWAAGTVAGLLLFFVGLSRA